MSFSDFITNIQNRPYETRVKILWGCVVIIGVGLIALWVFDIKRQNNQLNTSDFLATFKQQESEHYFAAEWAEEKNDKLYIYFKVTNNSKDILNTATLENIVYKTSAGDKAPEKILDRQQQPFVKKVLSNTENYGTLIVPMTADKTAEVVFKNIFFESSPGQIFSETLKLDIEKLKQTNPVRS